MMKTRTWDLGRPGASTGAVTRVLSRLAAQDWLVAAYLLVLLVSVTLGTGPHRTKALACLVADTAVFVGCMAVARSDLAPKWRVLGNVLYRVGLIGALISTFLQLHFILPAASERVVDAHVYRLDLFLFGFEPAVVLDRFVTPATTEWFAFFYYSYFFILCLYLVPMAVFERRVRVLSELSAGLLFVVCVGHCVYLLVPGRGPYVLLEGQFQHELSGGTWWPIVKNAVDSVGGNTRKDIFPSLHTACPTFLTLFSFRNRALRPYRYIWPVTAFFTSQIILATMFLRWHYLIDVIAGLTLAVTAFLLSGALVPAEQKRRRVVGSDPVWQPLFGRAEP